MNVLESLSNLVDGSDVTIHECRRCGAKLSAGDDACRRCGSAEIAHYEW